MAHEQVPPLQTQFDAVSVTPSAPETPHRTNTFSSVSKEDERGPSVRVMRQNSLLHNTGQGQGGSEGCSPADTIFGPTTPRSSTPGNETPDASAMAVHGSVASTPFSPENEKHDRTHHSDWERNALRRIKSFNSIAMAQDPPNSASEMAETSIVLPPVHDERIIVIDFDNVCLPEGLVAGILEENRGEARDATDKANTLSELLCNTSPVPGSLAGLSSLHNFGHSVHIISSLSETDRQAVTAWLNEHGITVGSKPEDDVAAAWFNGPPPRDDGESAPEQAKAGLDKLKTFSDTKAALFISRNQGSRQPSINPDAPTACLLLPPSGSISFANHISHDGGASRNSAGGDEYHEVQTWGDVLRWVKAWDREALPK